MLIIFGAACLAVLVEAAVRNFVLLNLYPYTTGHLMIVPYAGKPGQLSPAPQ